MKATAGPTCPKCKKPTGHLQTFAHQTTDGAGNMVTVGRGYCSVTCAEKSGSEWRKIHIAPPQTLRDQQHGGKVVRMGTKA